MGTSLVAHTDQTGYYRIERVPLGEYDVRVQAVGFESAVYADHRVTAGQSITINFQLRPLSEREQAQFEADGRGLAIQPGFGLGGLVGVDGFTGSTNRPIGEGASFGAFIRYGTRIGLFLHAGGQFSSHSIEGARQSYTVSNWYLEPRFVLLHASSTWAPFVAGRLGHIRETAEGGTAALTASGRSLGGGAGVMLRMGPQVAVEGGASLAAVTFGDYAFQGELAWKQCLDAVVDGSPLPASVVECTDAAGVAAILCYPPYYDFSVSGDCVPPKIPYPGSRRTGSRFRIWFAIHLSFTRP